MTEPKAAKPASQSSAEGPKSVQPSKPKAKAKRTRKKRAAKKAPVKKAPAPAEPMAPSEKVETRKRLCFDDQRPGRTLPDFPDHPVDCLWRILEDISLIALGECSRVKEQAPTPEQQLQLIRRLAQQRWRCGDLRQDNTLRLVGEE